jgi:hypothetical protein
MHDRTVPRDHGHVRRAISICPSIEFLRLPCRGDMGQQSFRGIITTLLLLFASTIIPSHADDQVASRSIQEDIWALSLPLPMFPYLDTAHRPSTAPSLDSTAHSSRKWGNAATPISTLPALQLRKLTSGSSITSPPVSLTPASRTSRQTRS